MYHSVFNPEMILIRVAVGESLNAKTVLSDGDCLMRVVKCGPIIQMQSPKTYVYHVVRPGLMVLQESTFLQNSAKILILAENTLT